MIEIELEDIWHVWYKFEDDLYQLEAYTALCSQMIEQLIEAAEKEKDVRKLHNIERMLKGSVNRAYRTAKRIEKNTDELSDSDVIYPFEETEMIFDDDEDDEDIL